ncbi:MAG: Inner rane transport permease YbhR, partial [Planctomycetota bacterium]
EERQRGTLVRLLVSPMSPNQILFGKALACFVTCLATEWMLVFFGMFLFRVEVSHWPLMVVVTLVTAFGFSGIMMLLAAGFRTQGGTQGAGRAVLLVLAMIGGGTVPIVFMPPFLRVASNLSPFKWAVMAAEGATWRSWGMSEMLLPLAVLAAIGVFGLTVGTALVRRSI